MADSKRRRISRRGFLITGAAGTALGLGARALLDRWESGLKSEVFLVRAADYTTNLSLLIGQGLAELGIGESAIRGTRVLLKPNLVEPHRGDSHINTHPLMVRAAAETFLRLGAAEVRVGEGAGHRRDTILVLEDSGLAEVLVEDRIPFVDLNYDAVEKVANQGGRTALATLSLPATVREADWVVSMPKMKTHHWAGVTLSMKNFFGIMPGRIYGWPKNVLHVNGIAKSIVDIVATTQPDLAIVDGIVGMEGDGPIMGEAKSAGVIAMGRNPAAVDATCARVMGIDPLQIEQFQLATGWLGPIWEHNIEQRGETIASMATPFRLIEEFGAHSGISLQG